MPLAICLHTEYSFQIYVRLLSMVYSCLTGVHTPRSQRVIGLDSSAQPSCPHLPAVTTFAGQGSLLKGHVQRFRSDHLCFRPDISPAPSRRQAAKRRTLTCAKARGKQKVAYQPPTTITAPLKVWPSSFMRQSETCACLRSRNESPTSRAEGGQAAACMAQVQVKEQLTPVEKLSMAPFWSTFCGTSNGAWQGVQAAFSPVTGKAHSQCPSWCQLQLCLPLAGRFTQQRLCDSVDSLSRSQQKHACIISDRHPKACDSQRSQKIAALGVSTLTVESQCMKVYKGEVPRVWNTYISSACVLQAALQDKHLVADHSCFILRRLICMISPYTIAVYVWHMTSVGDIHRRCGACGARGRWEAGSGRADKHAGDACCGG